MAFTQVALTGTIEASPGVALLGVTVTASLSGEMSDGTTVITPVGVSVKTAVDGTFSLTVPANDDTTTTPTGRFYNITVQSPPGQFLDQFSVVVPHASSPTVALYSLPRMGPTGTALTYGVATFNTRTGVVVLSKADVTGTGLGLSDVAAPTADVPFGGHKITGLANGTASTDGVAYGQLAAYAPAPTHSTTPEAFGAVGNTPAHDDAPAIEAAIASVVAACIADGSMACEVVFNDATIYYANRAPVQNPTINGTASNAYGQISLPFVPLATGYVRLTLRSKSRRQSDTASFNAQPCAIQTTYGSAPGFDATFGIPAVVSGAQFWTTPTAYSGLIGVVDGVSIIQPTNPKLAGWAFSKNWGLHILSSAVYVPTGSYTPPAFCTNPAAVGVVFPFAGNSGVNRADFLNVTGMFLGIMYHEHFLGGNLWLWSNVVSCHPTADGPTTPHSAHIRLLDSANQQYVFATGSLTTTTINDLTATAGSGTRTSVPTDVDLLDLEDIHANQVTHIKDANNFGRITARFRRFGASAVPAFSMTGGKYNDIKETGQGMFKGYFAPAVPAASTASVLKNAFAQQIWRDCLLIVTGGTGVTVSIDGQTTGLSTGAFLVPSNVTFNLGAYSVAPTLMAVAA